MISFFACCGERTFSEVPRPLCRRKGGRHKAGAYPCRTPSMAEPKDFLLEYAKSGRSKCKRSKAPIEKGELRVGQSKPSIYGEEGDLMWVWYKVGPFFDMMMKMKKSTKKPNQKREEKTRVVRAMLQRVCHLI